MSEHLTHIAVCEDNIRLILYSDDINNDFKNSLKNHPDIAVICSAARGNHFYAVPFIEKVRNEGITAAYSNELLASAIGWLSHRGADRQMKPLTPDDMKITNPKFSRDENQIYQDAVTFDKVYGGGERKSLSPYVHLSKATLGYRMNSNVGSNLLHAPETEEHFITLIQKNLLELHKFNGESQSFEQWLDQFPDSYQNLSENLNTYIEAFSNPDSEKMENYIYSVNYYDENDDIIRLARAIHEDRSVTIELEDALSKVDQQSQYAQALAKSFKFVKKASEFYENKIDKPTLYDFIENYNESHRI